MCFSGSLYIYLKHDSLTLQMVRDLSYGIASGRVEDTVHFVLR